MKKKFLKAFILCGAMCFMFMPFHTAWGALPGLGLITSAIGNDIAMTVKTLILSAALAINGTVTLVVSWTGYLFDEVLKVTTPLDQIGYGLEGAIISTWRIIRDIGNIFIVFSLLYLAIKTIINGDGFADKKTLGGILLVAIFINFSLFFAKDVVFKTSNYVGNQVLAQVQYQKDTGGDAKTSEAIMYLVKPQVLLGPSAISMKNLLQKNTNDFGMVWTHVGQTMMISFIMFCLIFIFLGASLILLARFFIFIFLMISSPFGVISLGIPWFKKLGDRWWEQLRKQAIFFPSFVVMLYVTLLLSTSVAQQFGNINFAETNAVASYILYMALIFGFMIGLLLIPGWMGAAGSSFMSGSAGWITQKTKALPLRVSGRVGRRTIGWGANQFLENNEFLKNNVNKAGKKGAIARFAGRRAGNLASASFDPGQIKIGGKTVASRMKVKEATKGQQGGYRGVIKEKGEKIKKRFDEDVKIFEEIYKQEAHQKLVEAKEKEAREKIAVKTADKDQAIQDIDWDLQLAQRQGKAQEVAKLTKDRNKVLADFTTSIDTVNKEVQEVREGTSKTYKGDIKKGIEKGYVDLIDEQRKADWNEIVNFFREGRGRGMEAGKKLILKGEDKDEKSARVLAKAIKANESK